ncbi:MAG TPA: asparaginase [Gemmatimonadaceae bacterium]|jgi:L-asparaginase type II
MRRIGVVIAAACLTLSVTALAQPPAKPRVHIIATGGTISNLGGTSRRTVDELVAAIPALANVAQVTFEQFSNIASGAITIDHWRNLARRIALLSAAANAPAGFVITHGTDTMEETAFFLDLTTSPCVPVVVTGAMRQADAVGADGPANLLNAVRVAASPNARGLGALILMNDEIFRAHDATKSNASRMDAFTAPDAGPVGVADPDSVVVYRRGASRPCAPVFDVASLAEFPRVDVIYAHIGADSVLIDAAVAAGARGIVIASVGRGGVPPLQGSAARRAVERGVVIAISTRTGSGRVAQGFSADTGKTRGAVIPAQELNPQKTRVLLMLALAAKYDARRIAELFRAPN